MTATSDGAADAAPQPPAAAVQIRSSRLHLLDVFRVATVGLRSRRMRTALSALGIAIGIGAMVAVLGISESSRADLLSSLDRLGTNLLTVQAGSGFGFGPGAEDPALPESAEAMLGRIGPVEAVSSSTSVTQAVYRSEHIPSDLTGGLTVKAVDPALLDALAVQVADGVWLDAVRDDLPVTVLGAVAAERLGIRAVADGLTVWLGGERFAVIGILEPVELAADIDRAALIGEGVATALFDTAETPETVYLRVDPERVDDVQAVIPATANPEAPDEVEVARPSYAIEARAAASTSVTSLFLGLSAVALLVGGVGIGKVMVISVLERRSEIGLRRALGATRRHVAVQFLGEALALSAIGGAAGVALGAGVTAAYDISQGWAVVVPAIGVAGGFLASLVIGAAAGLYPAMRAARLTPTDALRRV